MQSTVEATHGSASLTDIARTFLLLGTVGFGGGMAVVALVQEECARRGWMEREEFASGLALSQFLGAIGPNAAIFVGYRLRGLLGGIVAVTSFLAPSVVLVIGLTALYARYARLPAIEGVLAGVGPAVCALLAVTAWRMGQPFFASREGILLTGAATGLSLAGCPVPLLVLGAAAYAVLRAFIPRRKGL